jgi:F-type H+-transporting ATPase subunit b
MHYPLTTLAQSTSGIGALGFDLKAFVIQLVTFLLALWILKRYAFGPILKVLQQRRQTIEEGVSLGEKMREEESDMQDKVEEAINEARVKADGIIADAENSAKEAIKEAELKAQEKADNLMKSAEASITQATARARVELEKQMVNLVAEATEAVIKEKVDAKKDAALIEKALRS